MLTPAAAERYTALLREELVPALGCTEPIAVAFTAAKAREVLGRMPERLVVQCSGNIIKNVKGVIVPTTGDMKGIDTSAVLGALVGGSERKLEVLTAATPADIERTKQLLAQGMCKVELIGGVDNLYIIVHAYAGKDEAVVEVQNSHTHITRITKNGETLYSTGETASHGGGEGALAMSLADVFEYARTVDLSLLKDVLDKQIECNTRIAEEGLSGAYGCGVGACLVKVLGSDVRTMARALPAAGSDARMGGCVLPVVINSGSGNQGMTASLPVIAYAKALGVSREQLYRALVLSNLTAIYIKSGIGKLSAFCGVVGAGCAAGAAVVWLRGGDFAAICRTIVNTLADTAGIVCDGAKPSCAAKIASAVDAALLAGDLALEGRAFGCGEGLVAGDADATVRNIMRLGRDGMRETDLEILHMMIGE